MLSIIVILLLLWVIAGILGLVIHGLFWLFIVGVVLFVITGIFGAFSRGRKSNATRR